MPRQSFSQSMSEHSSPWFVPNKPIQQVTLCCKIERQEAIKKYHSMMAMTRTLSTSSRCGSIPYTFELMELVPWLWLASESSLQLTMSYYRSSLYGVSQSVKAIHICVRVQIDLLWLSPIRYIFCSLVGGQKNLMCCYCCFCSIHEFYLPQRQMDQFGKLSNINLLNRKK